MNRVRHIAIASRDPDAAVEFYTKAMGWKVVRRRLAPDGKRSTSATLTDGHINITLIQPRKDQIGLGMDYQGLHHIGVVVDDVDAWAPKLEALGAPQISTPADVLPDGHFEIKFRGPDNVVFDISNAAWPGSVPMTEGELAESK